MNDTKPDICRVMAEAIWSIKGVYFQGWDKDVFVDDIAEAIHKHTIVPEMVEFLSGISKWDQHPQLRAEAEEILVKAKGRKP